MVTIVRIDSEGDALNIVRILFKEYSDELNVDLCFQSFDEELKDPLKKYGPSAGALFLAYYNDEIAGCIALQALQQPRVCEMKRLFVRSEFRKHGIGEALVKKLIDEVRLKGYLKMVLDTLERLQPAIKLYLRNGFVNTSAYYNNPLPGVVYMEREL